GGRARPDRGHHLRHRQGRARGDRALPGGGDRPDAVVPADGRARLRPAPPGGGHGPDAALSGLRAQNIRTSASVPRWKLSSERCSFGECAAPPAWLSPLIMRGAPTASWKSRDTGIEPPARTRTAGRPNAV